MSTEFSNYFSALRAELEKLPSRPPKSELLHRARQIPLLWPESEFPPDRPLADQFQRALLPWGARIHAVQSESEVVTKAASIIEDTGGRALSRWRSPRLDLFDWETGLAHLNPEWIIPTDDELRHAADESAKRDIMLRLEKIDVGITDCDLAVAHTGSMLCIHGGDRNGYTNLFPWTSIAVVWTSQLVRTVQDALDWLAQEQTVRRWPSNVVFITGPSRSGDIDLTSGQGAAGPGRAEIILVRDS